jgi:hypothetical protein
LLVLEGLPGPVSEVSGNFAGLFYAIRQLMLAVSHAYARVSFKIVKLLQIAAVPLASPESGGRSFG